MRPISVRQSEERAVEDRGTDYRKERVGTLDAEMASRHARRPANRGARARPAAASESSGRKVEPQRSNMGTPLWTSSGLRAYEPNRP
jgi:hypothetical protein